jgi:hypothetical protein
VVFTHRPLFDLRPDWEWFTSDGDEVMKVLAPFENVTVLYGHIHREDVHDTGRVHHVAARSLAWGFPPPTAEEKKPDRFDPAHPWAHLGLDVVRVRPGDRSGAGTVGVDAVELATAHYSGTEGFAQALRPSFLGER